MDLRRLRLAAAAAAVTLIAAGCGGDDTPTSGGSTSGTSAPAGGGTLVIWADDKRAPVLKEASARFTEQTGVTVDVQAVSKDLQVNFVTAAQAGEGPDLVLGAHDWIGNLVQNGTIDPIQMTDDQKGAFDEKAIQGVTFNGQTYGVPYALENLVLFRNTTLAPEEPSSIEDMVATGKQLVADGKATEIMALPIGQNGDAYHAYPFYTSAGGYLFGKAANGDYDPKDLGVAQPSAVAAMEKFAQLGEAGEGALKRSITAENLLSLFTGGQTAYMVSGPWQIAEIKKAGVEYDITPIPGFEGADPARSFVGVQAMYVASKGKNKAVAQEFATNFFATPEVAVALYELDPRPPALTAAFDQVKGSDPDLAKVLAAGENGDILPAIPAMASVWDPFGKAEAAIVGGAPPAETIAAAATAIQAQIK